jgi:copper(I)-binding protein
MRLSSLVLAVLYLTFDAAGAHDYQVKSIAIDHAFARATPPGARSGAAFFVVENVGTTADRLVRAASPIAGAVELHQMATDGGVMRMRALPALEVRPGEKVELKPGGYHVMLLDLKRPLKAGDTFVLTLTFENAGTVEVAVQVEAMGATGGMMHKQ